MKELNACVVFNLMLCKINFVSGIKGQEKPDSWLPNAYCWQRWHELPLPCGFGWRSLGQRAWFILWAFSVRPKANRNHPELLAFECSWLFCIGPSTLHVARLSYFTTKMQNVPNQRFSPDTQRSQTVSIS